MQDGSSQSFVSDILICVVGYGMLLALPEALSARLAEVRQMEPVERNLQRVSHSIAYIAATLAIIFGGYWPLAIDVYASVMPDVVTERRPRPASHRGSCPRRERHPHQNRFAGVPLFQSRVSRSRAAAAAARRRQDGARHRRSRLSRA